MMNDQPMIGQSLVDQQLTAFWSQSKSKWPPQQINVGKYKKGSNSISFTEIDLEYGVNLAESRNTLWKRKQVVQELCIKCYH